MCGETPACAHLSAPVPLPQVGPAIPGSAVNTPVDGRHAEDARGACPEPLLVRSLTSVEAFVPDLLYVMVNFKWAPYVLFAASGKVLWAQSSNTAYRATESFYFIFYCEGLLWEF